MNDDRWINWSEHKQWIQYFWNKQILLKCYVKQKNIGSRSSMVK
jgi:hypothetical protein